MRLPAAPTPRMAFVIALVVHGAFALATGPRHGADTVTYSRAGDLLVASGFDYPDTLARVPSTYPPLMYLLFATTVALLKVVLGRFWDVGLVVLNVLAAAGVAAALVAVARRAAPGSVAAWGGLGLFLGCAEILKWTPFAISDGTFLLVSFLVFFLCVDRITTPGRSWVPVFATAALAALYRPTGAVLLPAAAWALFLARSRPGAGRRVATAALGVGAVAGTLLFSWIMQRPARWPVGTLAGTVRATAEIYASGQVVWDRPETYHAHPTSVADFAALAADRTLHFFALTATGFSTVHVAANVLFFIPCYGLALWLAVDLLRGTDGLAQPQRDVFLTAAAFLLVTALFHGLLQVDYDWRYRLPVLPHLALMGAVGLAVRLRGRVAA